MVNTQVNLCGIELSNPIIPASGTFGFGYEFAEYYDLNILGSFSFKGTTLKPRFGNQTPRIADAGTGIINSVGLQNPGIEQVAAYEMEKLKEVFNKKVIANISGFSRDDFMETCARADVLDNVGWIEVNISCPNVQHGGMAFGTTPQSAQEITLAIKSVTTKPVIVKLSPNVTDIAEIAVACESGGADAVSLTNTFLGMRIDLHRKQPVLAKKFGGYSGKGVFPISLYMVYQVYEAVKIPIIGIGGIDSADDVIEMMLAGATAVEVGAANLVNPYVCKDIIEALPSAMEKYHIDSLQSIVGEAHGK